MGIIVGDFCQGQPPETLKILESFQKQVSVYGLIFQV